MNRLLIPCLILQFLVQDWARTARADGLDTVQQPPAVSELFRRWGKWRESLKQLPPHRCVYELSLDSYPDIGVEKSRLESYSITPDYRVSLCELFLATHASTRLKKFNVSIVSNAIRYQLNRSVTTQRWTIANTTSSVGDGNETNCFRTLLRIPGTPEDTSYAFEDIYEVAKVVHDTDQVSVQFIVREPIEQIFDGLRMVIPYFNVSFHADQEWLPIRIDRQVSSDGLEYVWRTEMSDFRTFGGTRIPFKIDDPVSAKRDFSDPLNWIRILEMEEVPRDEVIKRCSLEFWQLQNIDVQRSGYRWYLLAGLLLMGVVMWRWQRSRRVAGSNHGLRST